MTTNGGRGRDANAHEYGRWPLSLMITLSCSMTCHSDRDDVLLVPGDVVPVVLLIVPHC